MANVRNTQCPWKNFFANTLNYMDSLHADTCQPQMKIAKFIVAARHCFTGPAMNPKGSKKSTEQLKEKMENPINSIKEGITDNRQSHRTKATSCKNTSPTPHPCKHDNTSCSQINGNNKNTDNSPSLDSRTFHIDTIQLSFQDHSRHITRPSHDSHAKPSCILILQDDKSHLDNTSGYESTDTEHAVIMHPTRTCLTPPPRPPKATNTQTAAKQPTPHAPRTSTASTHPQQTRKIPCYPHHQHW